MVSPEWFTCPHCEQQFPPWYWGVSGRAGGLGTIKKAGLAWANFNRHVKACQKKARFPPGCTCRIATVLPDGTSYLGGVDDCPIHGFGE